jgi:hypothetical protein
MSKIIKNFSFLVLFAITFITFSCKKEVVGPAGPAGASGLNGINGTNGKDGTSGTNGKDGNANVQGQVFKVDANKWQKVFYQGSTTYYYYEVSFDVPAITQSVVDKGIVACYRTGTNTNIWTALPYSFSFPLGSTVQVINYDVNHSLGKVYFRVSSTDDLLSAPVTEQNYKVVIITPQGKIANPNVNYNNYAEVAEKFGLE